MSAVVTSCNSPVVSVFEGSTPPPSVVLPSNAMRKRAFGINVVVLFILLAFPLFLPSVVLAQEPEGCNCEQIVPTDQISIERMAGAEQCCYLWEIPYMKNTCTSAINSVSYQLLNPPDCFNHSFDVWDREYPVPNHLGTFIPNRNPLPYTLPHPILPNQTFSGQTVKMCPQFSDDYVCPCTSYFSIEITIRFADGTVCTITRSVHMWAFIPDKNCCYDDISGGVFEINNNLIDFILTPNPTQSKVNVTFGEKLDQKQKYSFQIIDIKGNILKSQQLIGDANSYTLEIETLPAGNYEFVMRNSNNTLITSKHFTINR